MGSAEFQDGGRQGGPGNGGLGSPTRVERGRLRKRGRRSERSQSLAEFALILPVLMIMVFGIIDFGMGLRSYISLTNATREGARFGAVGNPAGAYPTNCDGSSNTTVIGRVCYTIQGLKLADMQSVSVTYPSGLGPGNSINVAANYTYHYITPLGAIVHFFTGGAVSNTLSLSTSTDMRQE